MGVQVPPPAPGKPRANFHADDSEQGKSAVGLPMQVTETLNDGLKREYKIVVSAKDIEEKLSTRLEEIGRGVRLPGFRPGKVPAKVLAEDVCDPLVLAIARSR